MTNHYVDKAKFTEAVNEYRILYLDAIKNEQVKPTASVYLGECVLLIAKNMAMMHCFRGYTWIDEMIGDAVEDCIRYLHVFDSTRSENAFGYFSKVCSWAFIRRIKKEKKQKIIKSRIILNMDADTFLSRSDCDADEDFKNAYVEFLRENIVHEEIKPSEINEIEIDANPTLDDLF
jgi:hypothetical protein